jgi:hypothetical protein
VYSIKKGHPAKVAFFVFTAKSRGAREDERVRE